MFSGITQGLFSVNTLIKHQGLLHYTLILNEILTKDLKIGASVAVDGVCQTVVAINGLEVRFDAMLETLAKTTLKHLFIDRKVSVERSIRFGDEIGGHEVSGHVFETGIVIDRKETDNNLCLSIQCSEACFAYIKPKGFMTVDGSSLTVGTLNQLQKSFEIYLIPETLRITNFSKKTIGSHVNLEPDMKTVILVEAVQSYLSNIEARLDKIEKNCKFPR